MKTIFMVVLAVAAAALIAAIACIVMRVKTKKQPFTVGFIVAAALMVWSVIFALCLGYFVV